MSAAPIPHSDPAGSRVIPSGPAQIPAASLPGASASRANIALLISLAQLIASPLFTLFIGGQFATALEELPARNGLRWVIPGAVTDADFWSVLFPSLWLFPLAPAFVLCVWTFVGIKRATHRGAKRTVLALLVVCAGLVPTFLATAFCKAGYSSHRGNNVVDIAEPYSSFGRVVQAAPGDVEVRKGCLVVDYGLAGGGTDDQIRRSYGDVLEREGYTLVRDTRHAAGLTVDFSRRGERALLRTTRVRGIQWLHVCKGAAALVPIDIPGSDDSI